MLMTALLGIALVALWRFSTPSPPAPASHEHGLRITDGSHARVMAPGGRYMDVSIYKFSDNRPVSLIQQSNLPDEVAERELQQLLTGDVDIIERIPVLSEQGNVVGERVVALFHIYGRDRIPYAFVWKKHGWSVYRIEGTSLDQVLTVERGLK